MRYRSLLVGVSVLFFLSMALSVHAATSSSRPVLLRMVDGRFYNPATGRSAATEAELLPVEFLGTPSPSPFLSPQPSPLGDAPIVPIGSAVPVAGTIPLAPSVASTTASVLPEFSLSRAVQRGKVLLLERVISSTTRATTDTDWRSIDLAIWTPETDTIVPVRIQKKGAHIRVPEIEGFRVQVRTPNGLNSTYTVTSLAQSATTPKVVAVRYPLYHPVSTGKKTTYTIEEVVYTPYARTLHAPEMIARGKVYLDRQVEAVYTTLRQKQIPSVAYPNKLVTEVVRPEVAKTILLIEHTGQDALKNNPQDTIETFFVELGLNETLTYAYEESPVGASGAPQFMPGTYKLLTKQPELELDPDFTRGMRNLENSMTAQVVYLDRLLSVMPQDVQTEYLSRPYEAGAYMVASYNAGEVRIRRAVKAFGEEWDKNHSGQAGNLQAQQKKLANEITVLKKKLKTKAVSASATQTKTVKKQLAKAQSKHNVVSSQVDALQKSSLRPETFYYLQKYRIALPYLAGDTIANTATTTSIVNAASVTSDL